MRGLSLEDDPQPIPPQTPAPIAERYTLVEAIDYLEMNGWRIERQPAGTPTISGNHPTCYMAITRTKCGCERMRITQYPVKHVIEVAIQKQTLTFHVGDVEVPYFEKRKFRLDKQEGPDTYVYVEQ